MNASTHEHIAALIRVKTAQWPALYRHEAHDTLIHVVVASTPSLQVGHQLTLVKLAVWICAFDDFADAPDVDDETLDLRIRQYTDMLRDRPCPELAFDPVAQLLREVLTDLDAAPLGGVLRPLFNAQLADAMSAMRWERDALSRHRRGLPIPLTEYVKHGSDSICFAPPLTAIAILIGERTILGAIPDLLLAERHACIAVRLANDRASWRREQREDSANVCRFASARTVASLGDRITDEQTALAIQLSRLQHAPETSSAIDRMCTSLLAVYRDRDLDGDRAA